MKGKVHILLSILLLLSLVVTFGCGTTATTPAGDTGPIIFGYVGSISSPGTRPVMDAMKIATDEINAAGGIMGRPVSFILEDGKGETSLSVAAAQRMVMGNKALVYFVEGRTEICLAVQPKSVELSKQYPHILVWQGPMGRELTNDIVKDYDNLKFIFRDWDPEDAHYCSIPTYFAVFKEVVGAKKMAWLWEDLAWTHTWRNGVSGLPTWEAYAKETYGLDTVYSKAVKARTGMYLPLLEAINNSGAEVVMFISSWFTDTEVFAKQWANSSANNIPIFFYGGTSHTYAFWDMTGGAAMGCGGSFYEKQEPFNPQCIPFLQKMKAAGIPVQVNVAIGYSDMYLFKKGIEKAQSTDVAKLIPALEGLYLEDISILGVHGFEGKKVAPFFHSRIMANPDNPKEPSPYYKENKAKWVNPVAQFQGPNKVVMLSTGTNSDVWPPRYKGEFAHPEQYKSPAQLRKEAGK